MNTTSSGRAKVTLPADDQILITREFDAPRHLVWRAMTTPDLVERWWAGRRGTVKSVEIDLRVGGSWRYVMEVDCGDEPNFDVGFHGEYREIVENERAVYTEVYEGMPEGYAVNTATFTELGDRTLLEVLVQHQNQEHRDGHINSGMEGGMQESFDLLEEVARSLR